MKRESASEKFGIGSALPEFELPNAVGNRSGSDYLCSGSTALVVFTCNHCPYVIGSEDVLLKSVREFEAKGLRTVFICSNDAATYPDDSFENMKAKAESKDFNFPYLHDEEQKVAPLFDAQCTPELFLFGSDHKLVFHGTVSNNNKDASQASENHIQQALEQLVSIGECNPSFVHPFGCSIKWKN